MGPGSRWCVPAERGAGGGKPRPYTKTTAPRTGSNLFGVTPGCIM